MDCNGTNLIFSDNFKGPSVDTREFCFAGGTTMKNLLIELWNHLRLNFFSQGEGNYLADPMASCYMVNWLMTSSPRLNSFIQIKKYVTIRQNQTRNFIISNNLNVSLGIGDGSLYTRCIDLKDDYHKKRMEMLAYSSVEFNYLETLAKTFIIPTRQNQFFQEHIFNIAPLVGLLLQGIQNLYSLDRTLKTILVSTLMLPIIVADTLRQ